MNIEIRNSFVKDAQNLPPSIQQQLHDLIVELQKATKLNELLSVKKLKGFKTVYRIRLGQYRVGFTYVDNTIELVRILNRKDIYKYFP